MFKRKAEEYKKIDMSEMDRKVEADPVQQVAHKQPVEEPVPAPPVAPKVKERLIVVRDLPTQEVRSTVREDGTKITFLTTEEALTELMNQEY